VSDRDAKSLENYLAISRAVAGELDMQCVLNQIAGAVKSKLLSYDHMDATVVLATDKSKHVAFETGVNTIWGEAGKHHANAFSPIRQLLNGEVEYLLTGDAWSDPRFHFDGVADGPIFQANLHSRIHVPMMVHGDVLGALNISSHEKNAYGDAERSIAQNIADLIAPYFYALNKSEQARSSTLAEGAARGREKSLRLGAQKLTEAMEAERQRLGMELHDQTLADLSGIYLRMSRLADAADPDLGELHNLGQAISRCAVELRGIVENAKPGVLELFGIMQAIEAQLERATQGQDRNIATEISDETGDLLDQGDDQIRLAVFRIVQEAVNNAVKHSGCRHIRVKITHSDNGVQIVVANDGLIPPNGWRRSNGGVGNIRVRADLIGASVSFERSQKGDGSRTVLWVPIEPPPLQASRVQQPSPPKQNGISESNNEHSHCRR